MTNDDEWTMTCVFVRYSILQYKVGGSVCLCYQVLYLVQQYSMHPFFDDKTLATFTTMR